MYKLLLKLLENALIPSAIIIFAKVVGFILSSNFLNNPLAISSIFVPYSVNISGYSQINFLIQNSFSDFIMYLAVAVGCGVILIKMLFFHNTHIDPKIISHLANSNIIDVVEDSFELYSLAFVWFMFLYIVTIYIGVSALSGNASLELAGALMAISVVFGWMFIKDIEFELNAKFKGVNKMKFKVV